MNSARKNISLAEAKKNTRRKKPYSSITYTTGDIQKNIDHFNKMLSGGTCNTNTTGYLNGTFKNTAAEQAAQAVGTFASQSPDGASSISLGGSEAGTSSGMAESINLDEAGGKKGRKVTRYFIRPQNIWCAKKTDIINALIDNNNEDCVIYTLNNLEDNKDITKLTNNDIIYYYEDGILYDKNKVKVMDYDLYVKHEEERKKINLDTAPDSEIAKVYDDRLTGNMTEDFNLDTALFQDFVDIDAQGNIVTKDLNEALEKSICCICGEPFDGYGNNPEPYMSAENGKCCDACNLHFVIPARLSKVKR